MEVLVELLVDVELSLLQPTSLFDLNCTGLCRFMYRFVLSDYPYVALLIPCRWRSISIVLYDLRLNQLALPFFFLALSEHMAVIRVIERRRAACRLQCVQTRLRRSIFSPDPQVWLIEVNSSPDMSHSTAVTGMRQMQDASLLELNAFFSPVPLRCSQLMLSSLSAALVKQVSEDILKVVLDRRKSRKADTG